MLNLHKIVKQVLSEVYSSPDRIYQNQQQFESWNEKDAVPFFVLYNGNIIYVAEGKRHLDYFGQMSFAKLGKFPNNVMLQGRYWKSKNAFSFWTISEDDTNDMLNAVIKVCNKYQKNPQGATIYYYHKKYVVAYDSNYETYYLSMRDNTIEPRTVDRTLKNTDEIIKYWIEDTGGFIDNSYRIVSHNQQGKMIVRDLNETEKLCTTVYQIYCDFLKQDEYSKFSIADFDKFLFKNYNVRFRSLMDYFHNNIRRLLVVKNDIEGEVEEDYDMSDVLEEIAIKSGLDMSEYNLIYYKGSDNIYSLNISTSNLDKFKQCLDLAHSQDVIVDRQSQRPFGDKTIYSARFRKK